MKCKWSLSLLYTESIVLNSDVSQNEKTNGSKCGEKTCVET